LETADEPKQTAADRAKARKLTAISSMPAVPKLMAISSMPAAPGAALMAISSLPAVEPKVISTAIAAGH
jgi:hypothetical protein